MCALARVWGSAGAGIGGAVLCSYLISVAVPPNGLGEALQRGGFVIVGGCWAMLISLVFWPLRPYRPVRLAVAACYRAVADFADDLAVRTQRGESPDAWALLQPTVAVRTAIEQARTVLASTRLGRPGETERGERLLVLHEAAEQMFVHLIALGETVESVPVGRRESAVEVVLGGDALGPRAERPPHRRRDRGRAGRERGGDRWSGTGVRTAATEPVHSADRRALRAGCAVARSDRAVRRCRGRDRRVAQRRAGGRMESALVEPGAARAAATVRRHARPDPVARLAALRHALRVATLTAAAVWLAAALGLRREYWITITIVIILQPYTGATTQKALQRVAGTVLGGIITAGLASVFHDSHAMLVLIFVFVGPASRCSR